MRYHVYLSATAHVKTTVTVEAASEEEAKRNAVAVANSGDVTWAYDGLNNDGPDTDPYPYGVTRA